MNPYVLLGFVLALVFVAWGGYNHGHKVATNEVAAAAKRELDATIATHNSNAVIDMEAARAVEEEKWKKRLKATEARHALDKDLARRPISADCRSECSLDSVSLELLRDRVRAANGEAKGDPASLSSDAVSKAPDASGRGAGGTASVPR